MKKITNENFKSVTPSKYYGFVSILGDVGFITREKFTKGNYITRSGGGLTKGNSFLLKEPNLVNLIFTLVSSNEGKNFSVYEFNTSKELFVWLAENS